MVKISKIFNDSGLEIGFRCSGHCGYASAGHDVVCSAVSILVINTINAIETFTEDGFTQDIQEKTGVIEFRLTEMPSKDTELLLNTLFLGLNAVQKEYGSKYIRLEE